MRQQYLISTPEAEAPDLQLVALIVDGEVIPVENSKTLNITTVDNTRSADTAPLHRQRGQSSPNYGTKPAAMKDCAWCGAGNSICQDCMSNMFATSAAIVATGSHLASTIYNDQKGNISELFQQPEVFPPTPN